MTSTQTENASESNPNTASILAGDRSQNGSSESNGHGETQAANGESAEAQLKAQLKEKESKYLYLYAEFENFKKRAAKERQEWVKFAWEPVASELLLVLDNFERALAHLPPNTDKNLALGLQMVSSQFQSAIQKNGVSAIETKDQLFDPNLHEAVAQVASKLPAGTIVSEQLKGYTLHGRLLRPAQVTLSSGSSGSAEPEGASESPDTGSET